MKTVWVILLSLLLLGCNNDKRDINATFQNHCKEESSESLDRALCNSVKYREAVVAEYHWFQQEADTERLFYRVFGAVVIVLSIAIPVLSRATFKHKEVLVTIASLSVAIGTSFSAFFNWGEAWGQYRSAEYAYGAEIRRWDIAVLQLVQNNDDDHIKIEQLNKHTQHLLNQAHAINMQANTRFFEMNGKNIQEYLNFNDVKPIE
ncbi:MULTISPECIES: DUF4231 domain-containing protein [unclassified Pseudoalteromonas]|uniref:DUF4231 domain-containing protein n=1 Tax=unclassified Pseudoalteromonas TaxID=194690 RepID=UPI00209760FB|nr:DUF4231 domain-containing protein [Pseudoalteromonas sp. XMcav2-N]MCO7191298.1 DUF4231 domain-containing protein [Pseudoalteromonas sp. XMcav2-N]